MEKYTSSRLKQILTGWKRELMTDYKIRIKRDFQSDN